MRNVYFYPAEFNTYAGSGANLTYRADINGSWRKEYKIFDHLGDIRSVVNDMGVTEGKYDYEPFGKKMTVLNNQNRLTFIGKENDFESNFGDFGVRKYDEETGRFTSVDPLWENYPAWSPYHYCRNNPVLYKDDNGYQETLPLPLFPTPGSPSYSDQANIEAMAKDVKVFVNNLMYTMYGQYSITPDINQQANCHAAAQGTPADQPLAKPDAILPNNNQSTIVNTNGIEIFIHPDDKHPPAHAHIGKTGAKEKELTRIGPNGKPLEGERELTPKEKKVVKENIAKIRKFVKKLGEQKAKKAGTKKSTGKSKDGK